MRGDTEIPPFTVTFDPNDGLGEKNVHCLNLDWKWPEKITKAEQKTAKRNGRIKAAENAATRPSMASSEKIDGCQKNPGSGEHEHPSSACVL